MGLAGASGVAEMHSILVPSLVNSALYASEGASEERAMGTRVSRNHVSCNSQDVTMPKTRGAMAVTSSSIGEN